MEREIEGVIENWSKIETGEKKDGTLWASIKVKLTDQSDQYIFFANTADDLKSLTDKATIGSVVKFIQFKKNEDEKFWNFKKGSFTVLETGDGSPVVIVQKKLETNTAVNLSEQELRAKAIEIAVSLECHGKIMSDNREKVADTILKYIKCEK